MKFQKTILLLALFITLFLFLTIVLLGQVMNHGRKAFIDEKMQGMYNNLNEMQTFLLMSETYGQDMACLASSVKLRELDKTIWDLGVKIDQYRSASEEFQRDSYYHEQKSVFNENEVFYLMLLTKLQHECGLNKSIISFFYRNSADCRKCDDQSFILTDLKRKYEKQLSIFSFDLDLNLTSVNLLAEFYNVTTTPCLVIDDRSFCGIRSEAFIKAQACRKNTLLCPTENMTAEP